MAVPFRWASGADLRSVGRQIVDLLPIGTLLLIALMPRALHDLTPRPAAILFAAALVLPLLWRRHAPFAVFAVIAAAAFGQWLVTGPMIADVALLIAFYAVAAHCPPIQTLAAGLILEVGVALAIIRYAAHDSNHAFGFVLLSGLVVAAGVLGINTRVRRAYLAEVEQRAARLELERDQQAQLAAAAERTRIAREMHDVVAHHLAVIVALTDGAALTLARDTARASDAIDHASETGRAALSELRRVLGVLRDTEEHARLSPEPRLADLDELFDTMRHAGFRVAYRTTGRLDDLPAGLQLTLYRIAQESLTNTVKHAATTSQISVQITRDPTTITLTVTNDATAPPPHERINGHGLIGMRERTALHGGTLLAGPTAQGWRVQASFPLIWAASRQALETASANA